MSSIRLKKELKLVRAMANLKVDMRYRGSSYIESDIYEVLVALVDKIEELEKRLDSE